jgi:hypothetical protein
MVLGRFPASVEAQREPDPDHDTSSEDDLAGRLLEREREQWRLLELPMEALPDDPLGRPTGRTSLAGLVYRAAGRGSQT